MNKNDFTVFGVIHYSELTQINVKWNGFKSYKQMSKL